MKKLFRKILVVLILFSGYLWFSNSSSRLQINPQLNYNGSIELAPIDKNLGILSSWGFVKSTWLSSFDVQVKVRPQIQYDQDFLDLLEGVLNDCAVKISPTAYASETYLSPQNPCLYHIRISDGMSAVEDEQANFLIFEKGVARRIKGRDICNSEELKILAEGKRGVVWCKSIADILKNSVNDHSTLQIDPELVFDFTDDEERRSVALAEVAKINKSFKEKGYRIFDQRTLTTALKNKGALREWFFEYDRNVDQENQLENEEVFDPELLKKEWLKIAQVILEKLNTSFNLAQYRPQPWGLESLRLNIGISRFASNDDCYVTWSHFVIEHRTFKRNGRGKNERKLIKIPLETFYQWARAEIEKSNALRVRAS